jgi:hypothetical protein
MDAVISISVVLTVMIGLIAYLGKRLIDKNDESIREVKAEQLRCHLEMKASQDREITKMRQDVSSAIDGANARVDLTEESLAEIKNNYISRFEKVYKGMNEINVSIEVMKNEILKAFTTNTESMRKEFITKEVCELKKGHFTHD